MTAAVITEDVTMTIYITEYTEVNSTSYSMYHNYQVCHCENELSGRLM